MSQIQFGTFKSKSKSKFRVFWNFEIQIQIQKNANLGASLKSKSKSKSRGKQLNPNPNPKLRTQFKRRQNGNETGSSDTWYWCYYSFNIYFNYFILLVPSVLIIYQEHTGPAMQFFFNLLFLHLLFSVYFWTFLLCERRKQIETIIRYGSWYFAS